MADSQPGDPRFNPLHGNRFKTRDDLVAAVHALFEPLLSSFSKGHARVQIDASTSTWDRAACDLEGYARPLFGIAPLAAGGGTFDHWELYRDGLRNGTDPQHPEYWGAVPPMDQRHVEAAAIAFGILIAPDDYWMPLDNAVKTNVGKWLLGSREGAHGSNNHKFFRVMVDLALESVGIAVDSAGTEEYLDDMIGLYVADGWYRDGDDEGDTRRVDYYNPFAMHYYGMFYAVHRPSDTVRGGFFKERARQFAPAFLHWFADTGANVPYGRSLAYRQCVVAYWGYLAVAGIEALPWGVIKGVYLRNMRWWAAQPVSRRDGILTLGYAYPNTFMTERYLSTGSPYWAMKAFSPLSLPADHPFWMADELPMPARSIAAFPVPGLAFTHSLGHTIMLTAGPGSNKVMRHVPEKYLKFAYSSRYGFSVESESRGFDIGVFDSMIAFSDDDIHYRVREHCETSQMAGNYMYSLWRPWADVTVETWLIPLEDSWHVRVHRIKSPRRLTTVEGGFAAPRSDFDLDEKQASGSKAWVHSKTGDFSGIVDASPSGARTGKITMPHANTSLMFPRTIVPQLQGTVEPDQTQVFACAVLAGPDGKSVLAKWAERPRVPTVEDLEEKLRSRGSEVEIVKHYARKR